MMDLFSKKTENQHHNKTHKTKIYRLSDLEMMWFALCAKYCGLCIRRREPWMAAERDARVVEWSKGLITKENIRQVHAAYDRYVYSDLFSDQKFEYKQILRAISAKKEIT